jgi:hypothetical protein
MVIGQKPLNCSPEQIEIDSPMRAEFESLAAAFLRLAEQAERNAALIIEFELPLENGDRPKIKSKP